MLITPHILLGAAIAKTFPNPLIFVPLALASHFVLDAVPHWQETLYPYKPTRATWFRLPLDLFLAISILLLLGSARNVSPNIWTGAFIGVLPDLDSIFYLEKFSKLRKNSIVDKWLFFHEGIQRETNKPIGFLSQIAIVILSLFIILS